MGFTVSLRYAHTYNITNSVREEEEEVEMAAEEDLVSDNEVEGPIYPCLVRFMPITPDVCMYLYYNFRNFLRFPHLVNPYPGKAIWSVEEYQF